MVGRCSIKRLKTAGGVGRSAISTTVAPTDNGKAKALPQPKTKKNFAAENTAVSSRKPRIGLPYNSAVQYRLACVCTVPFGLPVEPDEYSQNPMSSPEVVGGGGGGGGGGDD